MNRRGFLTCAGLAALVLTGGLLWYFDGRSGLRKNIRYSELPEQVQALHHPDFVEAFPALSIYNLIAELKVREIHPVKFNANQVLSRARHDQLTEFNGFMYTRSELLLYALVARLHADH